MYQKWRKNGWGTSEQKTSCKKRWIFGNVSSMRQQVPRVTIVTWAIGSKATGHPENEACINCTVAAARLKIKLEDEGISKS